MRFISRIATLEFVFQAITVLNCLAVGAVLLTYAYGGLYSRYMADDYCGSSLLMSSGNFLAATYSGYQTWYNSYSRLFFMQLSDWVGLWGIRLFPGATLALWTISLSWLFVEIGRVIRAAMPLRVAFWMAGLAIFVSLYQTPALYQILYWRTGVIPYTLPLVFITGIAAFLLWYGRQPYKRSRFQWAGAICLILVLVAGGLSETTSALLVGFVFLAASIAWITRHYQGRADITIILFGALSVAVLALLITAFSPGTSARLDRIMAKPPLYNPFELSIPVIIYSAQFLWDNIKVTPLPMLVSILVPFLILYLGAYGRESLNRLSTRHLVYAILILLVLMFVAIGFSYAPSAFARTYPAARARFPSHFVMNLTLLLAGGMLGILASRIRVPIRSGILRGMALIVLGGMCVYPIRASLKTYESMPHYQHFASSWDERDAFIRREIADGATDLVVVQLDSIGGVGEYKGNEKDWINRCAARFYGLNTLRAP